jgi:hypothetical protein
MQECDSHCRRAREAVRKVEIFFVIVTKNGERQTGLPITQNSRAYFFRLLQLVTPIPAKGVTKMMNISLVPQSSS